MRTARRSKLTTVVLTAAVPLGMFGVAFAMVPLYDWFCRVTGIDGTPRIRGERSTVVSDLTITVRFDANTDAKLPWHFAPKVRSVTVPMGKDTLAFYTSTNRSDAPVVGQATFNVTPLKAAQYFIKIECFCFTEQLLQPGQTVEMPVLFSVDPAIRENPDTADVTSITLSYTFFRLSPDGAGAADKAGLDAGGARGKDAAARSDGARRLAASTR